MKKIALISDTHGFFAEDLLPHVAGCDELWHAGDIGNMETAEKYEGICPVFRAVYGNIDDAAVRVAFPLVQSFSIAGLQVLMIHIGGYPGRYTKAARERLQEGHYGLFISGHSHIAKVMKDQGRQLIHMNPGSCGHHGFHIFRTMLRFTLDQGKIEDLVCIELGKRGQISKK